MKGTVTTTTVQDRRKKKNHLKSCRLWDISWEMVQIIAEKWANCVTAEAKSLPIL